jgi:hypothetical protein
MNVDHFKDLPEPIKEELLTYINKSYVAGNTRHTAYGLKQHYTYTHQHNDYHVTSRCFMEAMVSAGYKATTVPGKDEPDWYFHVKVL